MDFRDRFMLMLLCISLSLPVLAQRPINGTVRSAGGETLIGATVLIQGTSRGTATDFEGRYELQVPDTSAVTLVYSYTGMNSQKVTIGQRSRINVVLQPDTKMLEEVVVTAYAGEQKQRDLVGSYEQVRGDDLLPQRPVESVDKLLEGQVAGVQVEVNTGEPGLPVRVRVRGEGSLSAPQSTAIAASGQPLYVLDGVPLFDITENNATNTVFSEVNDQRLNPLMFVAPDDIESITVLKDAAATAIYGANASNGVILITTKKGKAGQNAVDFSFNQGFSNPINEIRFLSAEQYTRLYRETLLNSGEDLSQAPPPTADTDWRGITQRTGSVTNASFSLSGGSERSTYRFSTSYLDNQSIARGNSLQRLSLRLNNTAKLSDRLRLSSGLSAGYSDKVSLSQFDPFTYPPTLDPFLPDGGLNNTDVFSNRPNPLAILQQNEFQQDAFSTNANVSLTYELLPGLQLQGRAGADFYQKLLNRHNSALNASGARRNGFGIRLNRLNVQWVTNGQLSYRKNWSDVHHFSALAGAEANGQNRREQRVSASNFPLDELRQIGTIANENTQADEARFERNTLSYFGQASYDFDYRYYISTSVRRDASSLFGGDVNSETFYALGAGWAFSEEQWLQADWLSFGKVRASYGLTGNSRIGTYTARGLYRFDTDLGYGDLVGLAPSSAPNDRLTWEREDKLNFGLDLSLWDSRLDLTVEHYIETTRDAISTIPVPLESGFANIVANFGDMRNRGWEITLNTNNLDGQLRWSTTFTGAWNRNTVLNLLTENIPGGFNARGLREGEDVNTLYGIRYAGVDPYNGKALYYLPDGSITDDQREAAAVENRVPIGRSVPFISGGLINKFGYRGLSLSFLLQYNYGQDIIIDALTLTDGNQIDFNNQSVDQLYRWQQAGDLTDTRRLHARNPVTRNSTRFLFDASHIRMANLQLSYRLPQPWLELLRMRNLQLNAQVDNLFYLYTTTAEQGRNSVAEYRFLFPKARTWSFGINIGL